MTSQIAAAVLYFICKFHTPTAIEDESTSLYRKQIITRKIKSKKPGSSIKHQRVDNKISLPGRTNSKSIYAQVAAKGSFKSNSIESDCGYLVSNAKAMLASSKGATARIRCNASYLQK